MGPPVDCSWDSSLVGEAENRRKVFLMSLAFTLYKALISLELAVRAAMMVLFIARAMARPRSMEDSSRWALDSSLMACSALI